MLIIQAFLISHEGMTDAVAIHTLAMDVYKPPSV